MAQRRLSKRQTAQKLRVGRSDWIIRSLEMDQAGAVDVTILGVVVVGALEAVDVVVLGGVIVVVVEEEVGEETAADVVEVGPVLEGLLPSRAGKLLSSIL